MKKFVKNKILSLFSFLMIYEIINHKIFPHVELTDNFWEKDYLFFFLSWNSFLK